VTRHDHLRDAVAIVDRERRVGEVGEDDTDLSAIIGVDRAGRVQDGDSVLDGQPAVWADLRLIAGWEFDADYQIPSAQKIGVATSYAGATNGTPFTNDFPKALAIGKKMGVTYKYAFMNVDTFTKLATQEETIKRTSTLVQSLTDIKDAPDAATVNAFLSKQKEKYKGLQIVVIDQDITIERADGTRTTGNPFEDDVILFSESKVLGNTFWKRPIDARDMPGSVALKAMHGHTLIKKYSEESPVREVTEGIANAFPAWNLARRSLLMQTNATAWDRTKQRTMNNEQRTTKHQTNQQQTSVWTKNLRLRPSGRRSSTTRCT